MNTKSTSKETQDKENAMTQLSEQAFKNWEKVLRNSLKLQEQAGQWWSNSLNAASMGQEWQKQVATYNSVVSDLIPETQKQVEDGLNLLTESTQKGNELFKKAIDVAQTPVLAERQSKWLDLWDSSLRMLRSNTEAVAQMQTRALDSYIKFVQENETMQEARRKAA